MAKAVGMLDGRYLLQKQVYETDLTDVYKGKDTQQDERVGVRMLKKQFRDKPELVRRFLSEWRAVAKIEHLNIIRVIEIAGEGEDIYVVTEHLGGLTLREYLDNRSEPLTPKETVHFATQILKALSAAHEVGILHRDLTPDNIIITDDSTVKVLDFGIARLFRGESEGEGGSPTVLNPNYISPEQVRGDITDERSDLYNVGVMMFEMLTGAPPFERDNAVDVAIAQINEPAPPVRAVNHDVPLGLADVVDRALEKEPRQRYQCADDMLRDVEVFSLNPEVTFRKGARPPEEEGNAAQKTHKDAAKQGKPRRKIGLLVPVTLGLTIAVVGACMLLSYTLFRNSGNPLFSEYEDIELPDFTGMQYEEVLTMLKKEPYNFLRLETPNYEDAPNLAAGTIISQNPTSANDNRKMVKANQRLYLTVARGIEDVILPDIAGMSKTDAKQAILDLGLRPYERSVIDNSVPVGTIVGSEPAAGRTVRNLPDTVVTILVAVEGRDSERTVPSIVGMTVTEAQSLLSGQGLALGTQTTVPSGGAYGIILSQSPAAGTRTTVGSSISVTVTGAPAAPAPVDPVPEAGPAPAPEPAPPPDPEPIEMGPI